MVRISGAPIGLQPRACRRLRRSGHARRASLAWREPLAKSQRAVTRVAAGNRHAPHGRSRPRPGCRRARRKSGAPHRHRDRPPIMAQTLHWPRHHAVEASALAISSSICMKISGGASVPPTLCGNSDAIKPVLDQGGNHRLGQTPGPLDLVGLARDQRRQRSRALDQSETGRLVHAFPRPFWDSAWLRAAMVIYSSRRSRWAVRDRA